MSLSDATLPHRADGHPVKALRVEVLDGPDKGASKTTASETLSVGTAENNDLVLTDGTVSRFHLDLLRVGDKIVVVDHGSTNGTLAGSISVTRAGVPPGSTLKLGRTTIRVDDGDTMTVEMFEGESLGPILGRAPVMRQLMARVRKAAQSDSSVLILGETGTGKEVLARAVHECSRRADKPFETVDCGSMLPTLVASELFGHEKGSFTGADRQHIGAFERANGGTIFLDEIGELPLPLQTALLGALERRSFRRVGGKDPISVDVRVVSATNRDLRDSVNAGTFRQDLYYRLAVITLHLPALRERVEDIPLLAAHFLRRSGYEGDVAEVLTDAAMATLRAHRWPGNVRELRNAVESLLVMGETPSLGHTAPPPMSVSAPREVAPTPVAPSVAQVGEDPLYGLPYNAARTQLLDAFEERYIRALVARADGNVSQAARVGQMSRAYLTRLLKRHGIHLRRIADEDG
ncbi:MAG: sigma 54-dependent Fis family transcriptional regulator [Myxococcota bacterium]